VVYKVNIVLLFCFKLSSFLPLYILLIDWMAMVQYLVEALGSFSLIACSEWLWGQPVLSIVYWDSLRREDGQNMKLTSI